MQRFDDHHLVQVGPIPLILISMPSKKSECKDVLRAIPSIPEFNESDSEGETNRSGRRRISVVRPTKDVSSLIIRELKKFSRLRGICVMRKDKTALLVTLHSTNVASKSSSR